MTERPSLRDTDDGGFAGSGLSVEALAWGVPAPTRSSWPARLAVLGALGLYLLLPDRLIPGPRLLVPIVPILEALLLVASHVAKHPSLLPFAGG